MVQGMLRFSALSALGCIPFSLLAGMGHLTGTSVLVFVLLALVVPVLVYRNMHVRLGMEFPWCTGMYVYSWLGWNVFFLAGNGLVPLSVTLTAPWQITIVWAAVMLLAIVLMVGTASLLTAFFNRPRQFGLVDETLDIAVYSLPLPMLLLGDLLVLDVSDPLVAMQISNTVFGMLALVVYALVILTMATIALYLYPRHGENKAVRLCRILVTAAVWLAINGHMLYGWKPEWSYMVLDFLLPVFRGSYLVYVTPGLFEVVVLYISMWLGRWVETIWERRQNQKEKIANVDIIMPSKNNNDK